jgi:acetoin utilization protein AcuB
MDTNYKEFIRELLKKDLVTISPETTLVEAREIIRDKGIRYLPVVNKRNKLIGLVADRDIREASPSGISSLSVWEINYLLLRVKVSSLMTPLEKLVTINPDTPLEDAVQLMHDNKIGCLPVVEDGVLYGIFTETEALSLLVGFLGRPIMPNESLFPRV